jgi:hypothetical protein
MTQEELNKVLEAHKHYLAQDCEGWNSMRANLRGANLGGAYLGRADLGRADLGGANLYGADLRDANLRGAYLSDGNLSDANLKRANLSDANLIGANLCRADLSEADTTDVKYNESTAFFALTCPEEGEFVAWKKVRGVIVKLRIPSEAKRSSATSRKCRCEFAEVLELQNIDGTSYEKDEIVNYIYNKTIYKVGEIVRSDSWDEDRWNECSHGIHFFITRDEAVRY